jgi:hypothetical protein
MTEASGLPGFPQQQTQVELGTHIPSALIAACARTSAMCLPCRYRALAAWQKRRFDDRKFNTVLFSRPCVMAPQGASEPP